MCNERYLRRRREADESREIWQEFVQTESIDAPEPPDVTEPEPSEVREAVATPER
ncbi:MAG TPA: hypothetical protein VK631_07900 [Solirubrobacteraceae bacterium]|nr:hypothetical protein [Solirubrobacteraceae bacterium]